MSWVGGIDSDSDSDSDVLVEDPQQSWLFTRHVSQSKTWDICNSVSSGWPHNMGQWATLVVDTHCLLERIARLAFTRKHAVCGFILTRFNISTPLIQRRRLPVSVRARGCVSLPACRVSCSWISRAAGPTVWAGVSICENGWGCPKLRQNSHAILLDKTALCYNC